MKFKVTAEVDIEIELVMDRILGGMSEKEYLKEYSEAFFKVESMSDIAEACVGHIVGGFTEYPLEGVGTFHGYDDGKCAVTYKLELSSVDLEMVPAAQEILS